MADVAQELRGRTLWAIGEVARLTGVPIKTIRYYADIGLLPPAATTESRYRLFSARDIWRLELIRTLRIFGFGLDDIQKLLSGDISIAQAIDVQLTAIGEQIAHLSRIQQVLAQARANVARGDESLRHLQELGMALQDDVTKRRQLLIDKFRAILASDRSPMQEQFVERLAQQLPETMSAEQAAAWSELVTLINDPRFGAALQAQLAPFTASAESPEGERAWPQHTFNAIMERAIAAVEAGATPDSAEVQQLVDEWLSVFAAALRRPNDERFLRWFVAALPRLMPDEIEQFWNLMNRVMGHESSGLHFAAQRLVADGVRWRAARLDSSGPLA